jgi:hypothetical protein
MIREELQYAKEERDQIFLSKIREIVKNPTTDNGADFRRYVKTHLVHVVKEDLYKKILDIIDQ